MMYGDLSILGVQKVGEILGGARDKLWGLCFGSPLTQWAFIFRRCPESLFVFPVPEVWSFQERWD